MVSPEPVQVTSRSIDAFSSPRISFSSEFLDEDNFISISPNPQRVKEYKDEKGKGKGKARIATEFEFLSSKFASQTMITADELFYNDGKLLPCWQMHQPEKLNKISLKPENDDQVKQRKEEVNNNNNKDECRMSWFLDDDPSPRPPKCTVLWKELLRLRKHRPASTLSPSSSSSSSSSTSSSLADAVPGDEKKQGQAINGEKNVKRVKKGLERTRSATLRIRPIVNVPICTHHKSSSLPPRLPIRNGRPEIR